MNALLLRDFDAEQSLNVPAQDPVEAQEQPQEPLFTFTEAELGKMLADARAEGHAQGVTEGDITGRRAERETIEAEALSALEALQNQIADFATQDAQRRLEMQQDIVDLFLEVAERVAPDFLKSYSTELVQARLTEALHLGVGTSKLMVTLSPATREALAAPLKALDPNNELLDVSADDAFTNGEARVTWENGFLKYNLDRVCSELLDGLREAAGKMKPEPQKV